MSLKSDLMKIKALLNFPLIFAQLKFNLSVELSEVIAYLKPKQKISLESCVASDSLIVLPTSYGKTVIYTLLPFYVEQLCRRSGIKIIVILPLNAILQQKIERFGSLMCSMRTVINGGSEHERQQFIEGSFRYLIGHPEDFLGKAGFSLLASSCWRDDVSHVIVDEAHCVVLWGAEFRIDFSRIRELRSLFPSAFMVGLTGTATVVLRSDIMATLGMRDASIVSMSLDRQNIRFILTHRLPTTGKGLTSEDSYSSVLQEYFDGLIARGCQYPKTIIYLKLKWCGFAYHEALLSGIDQIHIAQYHASLPGSMKADITQRFAQNPNSLRIVFATEALGMGIDIADIRQIVHIGPPVDLETYVQEVGRAGRDGLPAKAILYYNNSDIKVVRKNRKAVTVTMREYCLSTTCRRMFLNVHFGDESTTSLPRAFGSCCDVCDTSSCKI